jgi:hypothetical protein
VERLLGGVLQRLAVVVGCEDAASRPVEDIWLVVIDDDLTGGGGGSGGGGGGGGSRAWGYGGGWRGFGMGGTILR